MPGAGVWGVLALQLVVRSGGGVGERGQGRVGMAEMVRGCLGPEGCSQEGQMPLPGLGLEQS